METTTKHTLVVKEWHGKVQIRPLTDRIASKDDFALCEMTEHKGNRELAEALVARYNNHEALVEALRGLIEASAPFATDASPIEPAKALLAKIDTARALLSQLEAGK